MAVIFPTFRGREGDEAHERGVAEQDRQLATQRKQEALIGAPDNSRPDCP
jgi:hypothetical protein